MDVKNLVYPMAVEELKNEKGMLVGIQLFGLTSWARNVEETAILYC